MRPIREQLSEGIRRRDEVLDAHDHNHGRELLIVRHRFALALLAIGRASLNDLGITDDLRGSHLGSVDRPFRRWIAEGRMVQNSAKQCKARRIVEWMLVDADGVRAWLEKTPLPTPVRQPSSPTNRPSLLDNESTN